MLKAEDLQRELEEWREARLRKAGSRGGVNDLRTVRVKGQQVVVVTKPRRPAPAANH